MKFTDKAVLRKAAAVALILCLALVSAVGLAQDEEPETGGGKGFVLFGLSALYDGTETVKGGVGELLSGNKQIAEGLGKLGMGLDYQIAAGVAQLKTAVDHTIVPGLDAILAGITGQVVPGLVELRNGLRDDLSPGLDTLIDGIAKVDPKEKSPGLIQGLTLVHGGLGDLEDGLGDVGDLLDDLSGLLQGFKDAMPIYYSPAPVDPAVAVPPWFTPVPTSIKNDKAAVAKLTGSANAFHGQLIQVPVFVDGNFTGTFASLNIVGDKVAADPDPAKWPLAINVVKSVIQFKDIAGNLEAIGEALRDDGGEVHDGVEDLRDGVLKIRSGIAALDSKGKPKVTYDKNGDPDTLYAALVVMKNSVDDKVVPGLDALLAGFNKTEAPHGEPGIVEGLTKISDGLGTDVSEGLGSLEEGIRGPILEGINTIKGNVSDKVIPGLEKMDAGIGGELQPGFTKVSVLLLVIWLVTLAVFLVVGLLIGRAGKAKAARGATM